MNGSRLAYAISVTTLSTLIGLCVAWELWLAPLRPGGSWMVLKVLPLLTPLFGVLRARIYTFQWAALLMLAYFIEGVTRVYADKGPAALLAGLETGLALMFILSAACFVRCARHSSQSPNITPAD